MSSITIFITIGHRANPKARQSDQGFTHDWTVFVKGDEGSSMTNFVEKVVFNLHESFPKPKRVLKEPPFEVSEQGYAGFILPIDIHFKNKGDPKKVTYEYDMFLRVNDVTSNSRREKLTFHNPSEDFKKRLIRAGGVVHDNKANGSSSLIETAAPKNRLSNHNLAITNHHLANSTPATSNQLSTIRNKHVIPSKDKSQQQHLSAASNSPNNQSSYSKDESSKTKDKHHQSKHSEFTDLFGTPIKTKSNLKESGLKSKKSKSSSEKSNNSRSSTPNSINNQLSKEYSEVNKKRKDGKLNKSNTSSSSSGSHSRSILAKNGEELIRFKKENDLSLDTLSSAKIKSPASIGSLNRYQELDRNNNPKYHSRKSNLIKSNLSSSSSSINSYDNHQSRSKTKSNKKRKKRSDSASSDSAKSARSSSSSSVASSLSVCSNQSRSSSSSNYSTKRDRSKNSKKRHNEDQYLAAKKKKKKEAHNASNVKKSLPNIAASRNLSSSLSSINSSADYKSKDDLKKRSKGEPNNNYYSKSKDRQTSPESKSRKAADIDDEESEIKKERKKNKDERKSSKKSKSKEFKGEKKKHKTQSKSDLDPEKIIKEKSKDSMNKHTSHKENNLKKEATTSTKISFSNNNSTGTTTLEITSFKNVKMLQSESKKSKQHQDQSLNQSDKRSFKTSDLGKNHYSSPLLNNRNFDNETPTSSPCSTNDKFSSSNYNMGEQEFMTKNANDQKKRNQKLNRSYEKIMSDMRKDREISPLSSDLNSDVEDYSLDNEYGSNESALTNDHSGEQLDRSEMKKVKRKGKNDSLFRGDESASDEECNLHFEYVNELIHLQKQISELKDKELLTEIIDIVRETGMFEMNGTLFDFDLMKLDRITIKKVKLCLS